MPEKGEAEPRGAEREPLITRDPDRYLQAFENSQIYHQAFEERQGAMLQEHPNLTEEKIKEGFLMSQGYKDAFWDFFEAGNRLEYISSNYSQGTKREFRRYFGFLEAVHASPSGMVVATEAGDKRFSVTYQARDIRRSELHTVASRALSEERKVDFGTARLLAQAMAVNKGLDIVDRQRDEKRIEASKYYRDRAA